MAPIGTRVAANGSDRLLMQQRRLLVNGRTLATHGLLALAIAVFLLAAGGCGTDRSAAPGSPMLSSDQGIWVRDLASSEVGPLAQGHKTPNGGSPAGSAAAATPRSMVTINGAVGGVLSNDRITLEIPPGAFAGSRQISLEVDNVNGYIECRLFPEGLQFNQPVQLIMSLLNSTGDLQGTTVYWYDPATGIWVDMLGAYDPLAHSVVAELHHFSDYRAGRAGW
jgi:hypothetical protein